MKLRAFTFAPIALPLRTPIVTAKERFFRREGVIASLQLEDGRVGQGEAMPLTVFGTEPLSTTIQVFAQLSNALPGMEVEESVTGVRAFLAQVHNLEKAPAARHGLEVALLDLLGQIHGRVLAQELNPFPAESVQVNALLAATTLDALATEAEEARRAGFWTFKIKVGGRPLSQDMERLEVVRRTVGEGKIRIDPNGCWSVEDAILSLRELAFFELELCEQPVAARDFAGLRMVKEQVTVPIAADEALSVPGAVEGLLDSAAGPGVDALVLKPMALGGVLPALELAQRAQRVGVHAYVTSAFDGPVARAAALHLAAAMPGGQYAHGLAVGRFFAAPEPEALSPRLGAMWVPQAAGLGVRVEPQG